MRNISDNLTEGLTTLDYRKKAHFLTVDDKIVVEGDFGYYILLEN